MRYSSALLLTTVAVGEVAAASHNHRHASFHARREASKRGTDAVNWEGVAYDLKDVDWNAINWSSVFASSTAAAKPTPAAEKPTSAAASPTPAAVQVQAQKVETPAPAPSSAQPTSQAAAPTTTKSSNPVGDLIDNVVSDVFQGVSAIAGKLGCKIGKNDKSDNGGIWIGSGSPWGMEVTNAGSQDAVFYCWKANGFSGMSINVNVPEISVGLKPGQKVDLSFAANVPAACAPLTGGSKLALFGGIDDTWAEVTFGNFGAFDVSRNVNMRGSSISMKGSKCTSDMETCVFKCKDSNAQSCEKGYDLYNCGAGTGGGGGYDAIMDGTGGGCAMGATGEKIKVSFS